MRALIVAGAICAFGAALEGIAAGGGVRQHLRTVRLPRYSPPLGLWIAIGLLYYAACFVIAYRILERGSDRVGLLALALLLALMVANAGWNYLFFRRKALGASAVFFVPYAFLASGLLLVLVRLDAVAAWSFLLYVIYLPYAAWWLFAVRRANSQ